MAHATELIRTTCPRDCYDACGILVVKTGGVIDRVKGDPDHPVARGTLCPKGEGRFEPVSWDEALEMIAGRLQPILAEFGGETIIQTHCTGTFSLIGYAFPLRFFHKIGATEVDPDTVRNKAGHADVCLHPEEARRRGLGVGDPVPLKNEFGELRLQISLSDRVPPGVALVHKGRWPKLDPGGANVNVLNGGERADMAESSGVHSVEADLVPLAKTGRGLL